MSDAADTIAAIATATGSAGVGVIRLSGPAALDILARLTGDARPPVDRRLGHARLFDGAGALLDDALCVAMRGPRSFTGEDVVEIHGHGGVANLRRLLGAVLAAGARLATAGEFTRRAIRAGKLDLLQAEAQLALIEARSERAVRAAQAQLAGALGERIAALHQRAVGALAAVEARIDFPEEGLAPLAADALGGELARIASESRALAASHAVGRALHRGLAVALRGAANAGKSSLFNALLGTERALVAAEPGTTRDYLEAEVVWDGVPVTLIDTAGERAASGIEAQGIARGAQRAAESDIEIWLQPADAPPVPPPTDRRCLLVTSKADLASASAGGLACSATTGAGLVALRTAVVARALAGVAVADDVVVTTERQRRGLAAAGDAVARAGELFACGRSDELVALELREASDELAGVLGRGASDAVLDDLFARYCIGK